MLTVETLRAYGADVDEGITRCMGNEQFYMKLVGKLLEPMVFFHCEFETGIQGGPCFKLAS